MLAEVRTVQAPAAPAEQLVRGGAKVAAGAKAATSAHRAPRARAAPCREHAGDGCRPLCCHRAIRHARRRGGRANHPGSVALSGARAPPPAAATRAPKSGCSGPAVLLQEVRKTSTQDQVCRRSFALLVPRLHRMLSAETRPHLNSCRLPPQVGTAADAEPRGNAKKAFRRRQSQTPRRDAVGVAVSAGGAGDAGQNHLASGGVEEGGRNAASTHGRRPAGPVAGAFKHPN